MQKTSSKNPAVVHIITHLHLGGAQKVVLSLMNGLAHKGYATYLIAGRHGELVDELQHQKHVTLLASFNNALSLLALKDDLVTLYRITRQLRVLKKRHPHLIVHTHCPKAGIIGRWSAFLARVPQRIHTYHGLGLHEHLSWSRWIITYVSELVTSPITSSYICVSHKDVATVTPLIPQFAQKFSLIRAAVQQVPVLTKQLPQDRPFIFGTTSSFTQPGKNIPDMLKAFAYARTVHPKCRLEIIGDGKLRPMIEEWIAKLHLSEVVTLHGWQHKIHPIMNTWNAFLFTSLWEGLPCAVIEARLMKLPVLSYDVGGIREVIQSGSNGYLYTPGDWLSMSNGMIELMNDNTLLEKLTHHKDMLDDFAESAMIDQHCRLYEKQL